MHGGSVMHTQMIANGLKRLLVWNKLVFGSTRPPPPPPSPVSSTAKWWYPLAGLLQLYLNPSTKRFFHHPKSLSSAIIIAICPPSCNGAAQFARPVVMVPLQTAPCTQRNLKCSWPHLAPFWIRTKCIRPNHGKRLFSPRSKEGGLFKHSLWSEESMHADSFGQDTITRYIFLLLCPISAMYF